MSPVLDTHGYNLNFEDKTLVLYVPFTNSSFRRIHEAIHVLTFLRY
jgi:hypothetical protein